MERCVTEFLNVGDVCVGFAFGFESEEDTGLSAAECERGACDALFGVWVDDDDAGGCLFFELFAEEFVIVGEECAEEVECVVWFLIGVSWRVLSFGWRCLPANDAVGFEGVDEDGGEPAVFDKYWPVAVGCPLLHGFERGILIGHEYDGVCDFAVEPCGHALLVAAGGMAFEELSGVFEDGVEFFLFEDGIEQWLGELCATGVDVLVCLLEE